MAKPIEDEILSEAQGAHRTSQEILALMQEVDEEDPIRLIFAVLKDIAIHQRQIASDLEALHEKLEKLTRRQNASAG